MVKKCEKCGKDFKAVRKERRFCSLDCSRQEPHRNKKCNFCGGQHTKIGLFCSRKCYDASRGTQSYVLSCLNCGTSIHTTRKNQKYCCVACANVGKSYLHECKNCGKLHRQPHGNEQFCSWLCYTKYPRGKRKS